MGLATVEVGSAVNAAVAVAVDSAGVTPSVVAVSQAIETAIAETDRTINAFLMVKLANKQNPTPLAFEPVRPGETGNENRHDRAT